MSTNAYTEYDQENIGYYYPIDFENRKKYYLLNKYRPNFSWNFGDPIHLDFYLDELGNPSPIGWYNIEFGEMYSNPFSNLSFMNILDDDVENTVLVEFYNSRFEKVYEIGTTCNNLLSIDIDEKVSSSVFYKGIFYCSIKLMDDNKNVIKTILNSEDCRLYVN